MRRNRAIAIGVAAALAATVAQAQTAGQATIEEITVTARRRAEDLQQVPLAVTAITAEQIARSGIRDIVDAIRYDTSANFYQNFSPRDTRIVIRGLSPTRGRPNVASLVDGIDVSSESVGTAGGSLLINPRLLDVERIEIIKGPQSALYGRSAFAGAVQYITRNPGDEFVGEAFMDYAEYNRWEGKVNFGGPLIDGKLGLMFSGLSWSQDGIYENSINGQELGDGSGTGVAATLRWTPSETLAFKLRGEYSDDEWGGAPQASLSHNGTVDLPESASRCNGGPIHDGSCGAAAIFEARTGNRGLFDDMTIPVYRGSLGDAKGRAITLTPDYTAGYVADAPNWDRSSREVARISLIGDWDVANGRLSSLTGYTDASDSARYDLDKLAIPNAAGLDTTTVANQQSAVSDIQQFSQELRWTQDVGEDFSYAVGALYWEEKNDYTNDGGYTAVASGVRCLLIDPPGPAPIGELFPGACGATPPFFNNIGATAYSQAPIGMFADRLAAVPDNQILRDVYHRSVYGLVEWNPGSWTFSAEARYIDEENTLSALVTLPRPFVDPPVIGAETIILCGINRNCGVNGSGVPNVPATFQPVPGRMIYFSRNDSYVTPRLTAEYEISDDKLLYASYAEGRKPGGFSTLPIGQSGADPNQDGQPDEIEFEDEKIAVYEFGGKGAWLDRRVRLNGALFWQDFSDKQVSTQTEINGTLATVTRNAASAEILGLELQAEFVVSERFSVQAAWTYLDSEYKDYDVVTTSPNDVGLNQQCEVVVQAGSAACLVDRSGNQLELTPENTFLIAATYRAPLLETGFDWFIDGDIRWEDERFIDDSNSAYLDSYSLANLRIGVSGDRWDVTAYVDNVFDDDTIRVGGNGPSLALADFRTGLLTQPPQPTQTIAGVYLPNGTFGTLPLPRIFGVRASYRFGNRD